MVFSALVPPPPSPPCPHPLPLHRPILLPLIEPLSPLSSFCYFLLPHFYRPTLPKEKRLIRVLPQQPPPHAPATLHPFLSVSRTIVRTYVCTYNCITVSYERTCFVRALVRACLFFRLRTGKRTHHVFVTNVSCPFFSVNVSFPQAARIEFWC